MFSSSYAAAMAAMLGAGSVITVDSGHFPFLSHPMELAALLSQLIG